MKRSIVAAPFLLGALALSGCSASVGTSAPTPQAGQAASATSGQGVDPAAVKASAIAAGRPAAAFDIDCQVWNMPQADTPEQVWANQIGSDWLSAHHADCPDQITLPNYFLESFKKGSDGELIAIAEDAPGAKLALDGLARDIMEHAARSNTDLKQVTARVGRQAETKSYTRGQWDIGQPMKVRAELAKADPHPVSDLTGQAWADEKMDQWLDKIRADSVAGLALGFRLIDSWSSPAPGELVVTLDASLPHSKVAQTPYWSIDQELQGTAVTILDNIYFDAPGLERITAKLDGSSHAVTVARTDQRFQRN